MWGTHCVAGHASQQKEQDRAQRSVSLHPAKEAWPTLHCKRPCDPPTAVGQSGDRGEACLGVPHGPGANASPGTVTAKAKLEVAPELAKGKYGLWLNIPNGNNTVI